MKVSVRIVRQIININRMSDRSQRLSIILQPVIAVESIAEIDSLQIDEANGQDLPAIFRHLYFQVRILDILDPARKKLISNPPARRRSGAEIGKINHRNPFTIHERL